MPLDKTTLKLALRRLPFYSFVQRAYEERQTANWLQLGSPLPPPPSRKRQTLREYGKRYTLPILVETGTYLGDTINSLRDDFERLYSIELSDQFFQAAGKRFAGSDRVRLLHGDSGKRLPDVLAELDRPALFWLDGHYSGEGTAFAGENTPINAELSAIAAHPVKTHAILIDDARCFGVDTGYPTLAELENFVRKTFPGWLFEVSEDLIRITPAAGSVAS